MRAQFTAVCQYCGTEFISRNIRRLYCSCRCRRDYQDDRRMAERAELREFAERVLDDTPHWLQDPWERCEEGGDEYEAWQGIWGNALLDAAPVIDDAPWDVPAEPPRKTRTLRRRRKDKHAGQAFLPGVEKWLLS